MRWFLFLILVFPVKVQAFTFLVGYEEAPTVAAALERVKAQPGRHVLLYFGQSEFCPPCKEARAILNSAPVRERLRPNYVVVNIDLFAPTKEEREVIEQVRVSWAPVLVFLDAAGKRVAYTRQLRTEREAMDMNAFVSERRYATSMVGKYTQNLGPGGVRKLAGDGPGRRFDDRPRLRDVLAQKHERLSGDALRKLLPGRRMHKENQEWFLTLELREKNLLEAAGQRKDGRAQMQGAGKWYVTRKGKLCVELLSRGVDENWCRHVFRAGDAFFVAKDLRPERLAYRFSLD